MRWLLVSIPIVALSTVTGCSEPRSPGAAARASSPKVTGSDLDQLHGTWRIETSTWNGVEDPEIAKSVTIHFQGDKFIIVDRDGNRHYQTLQWIPKGCLVNGLRQPICFGRSHDARNTSGLEVSEKAHDPIWRPQRGPFI